MPPRVYLEPLPEGSPKGKFVPERDFEKALTEYYRLSGWDEQGRPTKAVIEELGLADLSSS